MKKRPLFITALIILDQVTKYLVLANLYPGETVQVLPFFQLAYVTNRGVAFGMFHSAKSANTFFIFFTLIVLTAAVLWYRKNRHSLNILSDTALMLVFSGAVGNLIDRIVHGHVVDFLDVYAGAYHWPAFNVADSCITVGGVLLALTILKGNK